MKKEKYIIKNKGITLIALIITIKWNIKNSNKWQYIFKIINYIDSSNGKWKK